MEEYAMAMIIRFMVQTCKCSIWVTWLSIGNMQRIGETDPATKLDRYEELDADDGLHWLVNDEVIGGVMDRPL